MNTDSVYSEMIRYYSADPARIQHFVKVHSFAALIGRLEGLAERTQQILEVAAYVHDIGIKPAEEKYGSAAGPYQEKEGPGAAEAMLTKLGFDADLIARVCYLVGHHHTYTNIDGTDYRILVEADFLVNLYEDHSSEEAIRHAYDTIFCTASGRELCRTMFGL